MHTASVALEQKFAVTQIQMRKPVQKSAEKSAPQTKHVASQPLKQQTLTIAVQEHANKFPNQNVNQTAEHAETLA